MPSDVYHSRAQRFASDSTEGFLVPEVTSVEVLFLANRDDGVRGKVKTLNALKAARGTFVNITAQDIERATEIMASYASANFDFVDCVIMAQAERLNITRVATFDRRDFHIFRPRHVTHLALLP